MTDISFRADLIDTQYSGINESHVTDPHPISGMVRLNQALGGGEGSVRGFS